MYSSTRLHVRGSVGWSRKRWRITGQPWARASATASFTYGSIWVFRPAYLMYVSRVSWSFQICQRVLDGEFPDP